MGKNITRLYDLRNDLEAAKYEKVKHCEAYKHPTDNHYYVDLAQGGNKMVRHVTEVINF